MRHVSAIKISDSLNLNAGRRFCRFQELSFDLLQCVFNALRALGFYFHSRDVYESRIETLNCLRLERRKRSEDGN